MTLPSKSLILSRETRPTIRSRSGSTSTPASMMGSTKIPSVVPQSRSLMITACATSTRRRGREPEAASEVTGVGGLERGVSETLTRAVSGNEVLQHVQAFAEVRSDWRFDNFTGGLGHQAAHTGKLTNLLFRTAGAGVRHNVDGVNVAFLVLILESLEQFVGNFFGYVSPNGDDFVLAFAVSDGAVEILLLHLDDFLLGVFDETVFIAGNEHVVDADGDAGLGGVMEAQFLQVVEEDDGVFQPETKVGVVHQLLHALFFEQAVYVREFFRQVRVENDAADGGLDELTFHLDRNSVRHVLIVIRGGQVDHFAGVAQADGSEQFHFAGFQRENNFIGCAEDAAFTLGSGLGLGEVIDTQHHVLRRNGERQTVRWRKNVARAEHEHGGLHLRFGRKRDVHVHLVAVKVR